MSQAAPFPVTPIVYAPARSSSRSPSPTFDPRGLPSTGTYTALPYLTSQRSDSASPTPSATAQTSAFHGSAPPATSIGHAPSSYGAHQQGSSDKGSAGNGSGGNGSGSGDTAIPSLRTPTPHIPRPGSPGLESVYPPAYEQFAGTDLPRIGLAYEPEPIQHTHQIVAGLTDVEGYDMDHPRPSDEGVSSPFSGDLANASVASRSIYSHDGSEDWAEHAATQDQRIDPLMRMRGGLVSAASVGPRDHEDYMRRVMPMAPPSQGEHSQSHSHSTH